MTDNQYNAWKENWEYRKLFVKIEKEPKSSFAIVTNDMAYVDSFMVESENEAEFIDECEKYFESERYKNAMERFYIK